MSHPGSGVETPLPKFYPTIMAKKINPEEKPRTETDDTLQNEAAGTAETPDGTAPGHPGATSDRSGTALPAEPERPEEENHPGTQAPDAPVLELLKKFPAYPSLYIDAHGGTFSPDTPESIRGGAALYENPFYNQLKDQS